MCSGGAGSGRKLGEQLELSRLGDDQFRFGRGNRRRPAVDGEQEARVAALELDRIARHALDLVLGAEPAEHPTDRRFAVLRPFRIDRARDDQAVDRARHRDVVEPQALGLVLLLLRNAHVLVAEDAAFLA